MSNLSTHIDRRTLLQHLAGMAAGLSGLQAHAQGSTWPTKPIKVVVPFAPGGSSEIVARAITLVKPGDSIAVLSNGGFGGIHDKLLEALKTLAPGL